LPSCLIYLLVLTPIANFFFLFPVALSNDAEQIEITDGSRMVMFPDYVHDGDKESVFIDLDGSVTGRPPSGNSRAVVVNYSPMLATSGCIDMPAQKVYHCPDQFAVLSYSFSSGSVTWPPDLKAITHTAELVRSDKPSSVHDLRRTL
jgi:hypothetical protein